MMEMKSVITSNRILLKNVEIIFENMWIYLSETCIFTDIFEKIQKKKTADSFNMLAKNES